MKQQNLTSTKLAYGSGHSLVGVQSSPCRLLAYISLCKTGRKGSLLGHRHWLRSCATSCCYRCCHNFGSLRMNSLEKFPLQLASLCAFAFRRKLLITPVKCYTYRPTICSHYLSQEATTVRQMSTNRHRHKRHAPFVTSESHVRSNVTRVQLLFRHRLLTALLAF